VVDIEKSPLDNALRDLFRAGLSYGSAQATAYEWGSSPSQRWESAFNDFMAEWEPESAPIRALTARVAELEKALNDIAAEIVIPVPTWKNGINFKKLYEAWRREATKRADSARAALAKSGDAP